MGDMIDRVMMLTEQAGADALKISRMPLYRHFVGRFVNGDCSATEFRDTVAKLVSNRPDLRCGKRSAPVEIVPSGPRVRVEEVTPIPLPPSCEENGRKP